MKINEIEAEILQWARNLGTAFTTADAFNQTKVVENAKEMSDIIRKLWLQGHLARKIKDNVRYSYIVSELATDDYEKHTSPPKPEEVKRAADSFLAQQAAGKGNTPAAAQDAIKKEEKSKEPGILPQSQQEAVTILPERFSLTLQTPGGITITISAGA